MTLLSDCQLTSWVDGGLDAELAAHSGVAVELVRGRLPLLHAFLEKSHGRLLKRLAREVLDTSFINRAVQLSRDTASVSVMSMWKTAWIEVLPSVGLRGELRSTSVSPAAQVPSEGVAWKAVHRCYGSLMKLLPYPEELEDVALGLLPMGDGVGLSDAELVYDSNDLLAGFYLSLSSVGFRTYPRLQDYVDNQMRRLGYLVASNYVIPPLDKYVLRFGRSVTSIAALSVWHSACKGLELPAVPSPSTFPARQLNLFLA